MAIEFKQSVKQTQNLTMSPQIQQAIKILTLGRTELEEFVSDEMRENPCLEEFEAPVDSVEAHSSGLASESLTVDCSEAINRMQSEMNGNGDAGDERGIDDFLARFTDSFSQFEERTQTQSEEMDAPIYERVQTQTDTLHEELEDQLHMMHLTEYEHECAMILIQYLDDNGFLSVSYEEVARENDIEPDDMEYALKMIQRCEPIGVGAKNTQDCLLLQLKNLTNIPPYVEIILTKYWNEFEKQDIPKIAKMLKAKPEVVKKAFVFIRDNLDPRPARQFCEGTSQIMVPDVFVFKRVDEWTVSLNEDGLPRLKVSKKYSDMVDEITKSGKKTPKGSEIKDFVKNKMKSAAFILRAIAERNKTILRVADVIVNRQKEFFEHGVEHLKPLTLRAVADELGLHESTISRTTTNKYLHSPRGIFELKYFFNAGMNSVSGNELANEAIKSWVAEYIKLEDSSKPLSDQDIATLVAKEKGVTVARRTIAKYRESLGIPSSSRRNRRF